LHLLSSFLQRQQQHPNKPQLPIDSRTMKLWLWIPL
jgi:hypothetical protein